MNLTIKIGNEWVDISKANPSDENEQRIKQLGKTEIGLSVVTQLMINHKLGIMDINEAIEKLWE